MRCSHDFRILRVAQKFCQKVCGGSEALADHENQSAPPRTPKPSGCRAAWEQHCPWNRAAIGGTRGIFHDITGRIRHDEEREKLIAELQKALDDVKTLSGLLPICAWCNQVRDDSGYWQDVESFLQANARLTHGLCPHCAPKVFAEFEKSPVPAIET